MVNTKELVWVVSFGIDEDGSFSDYLVEQIDLGNYSRQAAENLRNKMGKGVFYNSREAEEWAQKQMEEPVCNCSCAKRCCQKNE
ncbi:hypothetical protein P22_2344 [Propionispora sp. 2/2-37]|uniref:hypothetical protein n=1 Tax=Propionispora sp. 2/2-37 TaxID=1677858 RepID=UPI0006BB5E0D|nr:hypothetical protein [Propionispora sp. 2/2-37]CUH96254.1 hypothetical protein P22_2344 [Propionispora sp. 2/2-37]